MAATSSAGAAAFSLRTRFIHNQCAAQKILAVERFNRLVGFAVVANFGETESARLSGKTVAQQRKRIRLHTNFRKKRRYLLFRSLERQITHIQFLHGRSPFAWGTRPGAKHEAEGTGNRPRGQRV
jgi:RNase P/RNase MRP subunit POP5